MSRSVASAKATSSARRMTGGSSLLLSGSGVPTGSLGGGRSLGRPRTIGSPHARARLTGVAKLRLANRTPRTNLRDARKFHRENVRDGPVDRIGLVFDVRWNC